MGGADLPLTLSGVSHQHGLCAAVGRWIELAASGGKRNAAVGGTAGRPLDPDHGPPTAGPRAGWGSGFFHRSSPRVVARSATKWPPSHPGDLHQAQGFLHPPPPTPSGLRRSGSDVGLGWRLAALHASTNHHSKASRLRPLAARTGSPLSERDSPGADNPAAAHGARSALRGRRSRRSSWASSPRRAS